MEHRRQQQDPVGLADAEGVVAERAERVQEDGTVAVDHAFRITGSAAGVADHRGVPLFEQRPFEIGGRLRE